MNIFRTTMAAGLILMATAPAHGMWQGIKNSIGLQSGLTEDTKAIIAAATTAGMTQVIWDKLYNTNPCMVQILSDKPLQTGSTIAVLGIGVPLLFFMSLRNNSDFWNKEGFCNRAFLMFNAYMSTLAAANLYHVL